MEPGINLIASVLGSDIMYERSNALSCLHLFSSMCLHQSNIYLGVGEEWQNSQIGS